MIVVQKEIATVLSVKILSPLFYDKLNKRLQWGDSSPWYPQRWFFEAYHKYRKKRWKNVIQYQMWNDANIKDIPMSHLLSHNQTKADLIEYIASKNILYCKELPKLAIASAAGKQQSIALQRWHEYNHEEADTFLIHHAVLTSRRNPSDIQLMFSPDTHVSLLVVANREL